MQPDSFQKFTSSLPGIALAGALAFWGAKMSMDRELANRVAEIVVLQMQTEKEFAAFRDRYDKDYAQQVTLNRGYEKSDGRHDAELVANRARLDRLERLLERQERSEAGPTTAAMCTVPETWLIGF